MRAMFVFYVLIIVIGFAFAFTVGALAQ